MSETKNKSALIMGCGRGLGRGNVEALAAEGANVWAVARDPDTWIRAVVHFSPVATREQNQGLASLD